jgi:hypothetical protein
LILPSPAKAGLRSRRLRGEPHRDAKCSMLILAATNLVCRSGRITTARGKK